MAVLFSFLVIALVLRRAGRAEDYPKLNLLRWGVGRALQHPLFLGPVRIVSVGLFLLVVWAGLFGNQNASRNLVPTAVWVYWWVGLGFWSAFLGDIQGLVNPWRIIYSWVDGAVRRIGIPEGLSLELPYPQWAGVWPGVILFLGFAWIELVWGAASSVPANLAIVGLIYSIITWTGMILFGPQVWIRGGEIFSIVFAMLGRFAPLQSVVPGEGSPRQLILRGYGAGLLNRAPVSFSMTVFVLLALATVTFDGFLETPLWGAILDVLHQTLMPQAERTHWALFTLALVFVPGFFLVTFLLFMWVMARLQSSGISIIALSGYFVFSLVPIALAYHLAHYLLFFMVGGQLIIPLASDPMGFGSDWLGTSGYRVDIAILNAKTSWYVGVTSIVLGHIFAVYLSHAQALRLFKDRAMALRSQIPMLLLMVGYTMISLWIIAQPVVEFG
jgi:hypothetical protein